MIEKTYFYNNLQLYHIILKYLNLLEYIFQSPERKNRRYQSSKKVNITPWLCFISAKKGEKPS